MKTLSSIKKDLEFNKGLFALIETLKTIAVSQYRALERKMRTFDDFFLAIDDFFKFIDIGKVAHPFLTPRNSYQSVIAVTSDVGFLGGLNMQIVNAALRELEKMPGKLIIIGERGKMYVRETSIQSVAFPGISDEQRYGQAMQLRDYVLEQVLTGIFSYLKIVYPRAVSFTVQRVETLSLLPFSAYREGRTPGDVIHDIIMESQPKDIVEYLVYLWTGWKLYEIFGLSRLSEFSARYIHLEESSQKLKDMDKKVRLEYFRIRHELVDRTMRELFAGRLLYK